ncbi:MAG: radical SAM protein [Thiomargarita sp.]|nr:radical SAM protein [Thiomargarita sp.]
MKIVFGPIPSRRLGRSLGINNIPPKACTYNCTYCQVGTTKQTEITRRHFYGTELVVQQVTAQIAKLKQHGENIDHLSFVPDGEPTLDLDLEATIDQLRPLGIKIAIITNGSLIWQPQVRNALQKADWISLKIDAIEEKIWRQLNIPHSELKLTTILNGMLEFAKEYSGKLVTETMLVRKRNVSATSINQIADFIQQLQPQTAYFLIPTRPPAISSIQPPTETELNQAYQILNARIANVEYLTGYEGNAFASTGNVAEDILSITAVHPMRREAIEALLEKNQADWSIVQELCAAGKIIATQYQDQQFYMRRFN